MWSSLDGQQNLQGTKTLGHFRPIDRFSAPWHILRKKRFPVDASIPSRATARRSPLSAHPCTLPKLISTHSGWVSHNNLLYPTFGCILHNRPESSILPNQAATRCRGPAGPGRCPVAVLFAILCTCRFSDIHTDIIDNQETVSTW